MRFRSSKVSQWGSRPALTILTVPALVFLGPQAAAADYATRDIGRWTVSASSDKQGCFLTRTYPAPRETTLLFGLDTDGSNRLTILNANWSIQEKERLKLTFSLSKASFPRHLAIGIAADGKKGFVTSFGVTFPGSFAASRSLNIMRGKVPVEELALDGSGAAVTELRACIKSLRASPEVGGSRGKDRIPLDPFAAKNKRDPH